MSRIILLAIITLITSMGCNKQPMDADNLEELKTKKEELDQTVFADETQAVRHEDTMADRKNSNPPRT